MRTAVAALILLAAVFILRAPLLNVPLERDEGEYAYIAQEMLRGYIPYKDAFDQKPPGIFLIYYLTFLILPQRAASIHLMLTAFLFIGALLLFLIGRKLSNSAVGMTAAVAYLILSSSPLFEGSSANTEQFMNVFIVMSVLLFMYAIHNNGGLLLFFCGISTGMAFLIKQPSAVMLFFFLILIFLRIKSAGLGRSARSAGLVFTGFLAPIMLSLAVFAYCKALDDYIFCGFLYNFGYSRLTNLGFAIKYLNITFVPIALTLFPVFIVSAAAIMNIRKDAYGNICLLWLALSFLGVSAGLIFRSHYFIQIIPPLSMLFAHELNRLMARIMERRKLVVGNIYYYSSALVLLVPAIAGILSNYSESPFLMSKKQFGYMNPFVESIFVGKYIEKNSDPEDSILVIGSEPQIYFYSKRRSATKYMYFYPLMLKSEYVESMQKDALKEIIMRRPKYIVFANEYFSLLPNKDSPLYLIEELNNIVMEQYKPVACALAYPDFRSQYFFDKEFDNVKGGFDNINNLALSEKKPKMVIFRRL